MPPERILILAGTGEARDLANALVAEGRDVVTSFAGVTQTDVRPKGKIRVGGFGGVDGLVAYLQTQDISRIVDVTHPFAAQMSAHAFAAAVTLRLPLLRLERPPWQQESGDDWQSVKSVADAAARIPPKARALVTTGQRYLECFIARTDLSGIIRTIEAPDIALPANWTLLQNRPPYEVSSERDLMGRNHITCLVSKNAGGQATVAKVTAARDLGLPVIMVERPVKPPCPTFRTLPQALLGITGGAG